MQNKKGQVALAFDERYFKKTYMPIPISPFPLRFPIVEDAGNVVV